MPLARDLGLNPTIELLESSRCQYCESIAPVAVAIASAVRTHLTVGAMAEADGAAPVAGAGAEGQAASAFSRQTSPPRSMACITRAR